MSLYGLLVFVDGEAKETKSLELLQQEVQFNPAFYLDIIDLKSPQGFMDKRRFHIQQPETCAVVDQYRRFIVRLGGIPISFFHLRTTLATLGYKEVASAIQWEGARANNI